MFAEWLEGEEIRVFVALLNLYNKCKDVLLLFLPGNGLSTTMLSLKDLPDRTASRLTCLSCKFPYRHRMLRVSEQCYMS
jgi:hypothetical protein